MEIKKYISVFDNAIDVGYVSNILRWVHTQEFKQAAIVNRERPEDNIRTNIRNAQVLSLNARAPSLTNVHWYNYLCWTIRKQLEVYKNTYANTDLSVSQISEVGILKYESGGFYKPHTDHCLQFPRILSIILLLNNDYEGGQLTFFDPDQKSNEFKVETKPGRMIMWPSNFLYPHAVQPVTKGTRYSVISWIS